MRRVWGIFSHILYFLDILDNAIRSRVHRVTTHLLPAIVRLADLRPAYVEILARAEAGDGTVGSDAVIYAMRGATARCT